MKIIYLEKEVKLGDKITINEINITVTEQVIKDNPDIFEVIEDKVPEYVECINISEMGNQDWYVVGQIYPLEIWDNEKHTPPLENDGGFNISDSISHHPWSSLEEILKYFKPSTKEDYNKQELLKEAKKRYPVGTKVKDAHIFPSANTHKVTELFWHKNFGIAFRPDEGTFVYVYFNVFSKKSYNTWAKRYLFTTEDGVEIFEGDKVTWLNLNNTRIAGTRGADKNMLSYLKYFSTKEAAQAYMDSLKEKTLEYYENILLDPPTTIVIGTAFGKIHSNQLYKWLKEYEPRLYWTKVLQLIANDLNGDWESEFKTPKSYLTSCGIDSNNNIINVQSVVYFKTRKIAIRAMSIMGENHKYLYD